MFHLQGVDFFDTSYLLDVTNGGYALAFPLSPEADEEERQQQQQEQRGSAAEAAAGAAAVAAVAAAAGVAHEPAADECGRDDSKINLWALAYRTDRRPLLPGCTCFACANHTRAYVHHLLQTHEMTAQVGGMNGWASTSLHVGGRDATVLTVALTASPHYARAFPPSTATAGAARGAQHAPLPTLLCGGSQGDCSGAVCGVPRLVLAAPPAVAGGRGQRAVRPFAAGHLVQQPA